MSAGHDQAADERQEGDDGDDAASLASRFPPGQPTAYAQGNGEVQQRERQEEDGCVAKPEAGFCPSATDHGFGGLSPA